MVGGIYREEGSMLSSLLEIHIGGEHGIFEANVTWHCGRVCKSKIKTLQMIFVVPFFFSHLEKLYHILFFNSVVAG